MGLVFAISDPVSKILDMKKTYSGSQILGFKRHWIRNTGSRILAGKNPDLEPRSDINIQFSITILDPCSGTFLSH
jgi:hypothetical protein